jgi:regulation of enolase protein 1 (concanavalin A-like superfamily)
MECGHITRSVQFDNRQNRIRFTQLCNIRFRRNAMHVVRTIVCKSRFNAFILSLFGIALLGALLAVAQVTALPTDVGQKTALIGLPYASGEWTVVNGEKGSFSVRDGVLCIAPVAHTNLFHVPDDGFVVVNAPMVLFAPEGDFTFKAKVSAQLVNVYDVAALVAYGDDKHWAKLCFENSALQEATVVAVVTREHSDDTNSETVASPFVYLAIARKGNKYSMHFSRDGQQWRLVRHFQLPSEPKMRLGFAAHTDSDHQFIADFSEIVYRPTTPPNMRQLSSADLSEPAAR